MTTRVIETWQYKGFWLGTEHTGECARIALDNASQRWKGNVEGETVAFVSKDWKFGEREAAKFIEMFRSGKLINHKIDFSEWNEVAKKWRNRKRQK